MSTGEEFNPSFKYEQLPLELDAVIGRGIKFKRIFSPNTGTVDTNSGIERINQSIHDILYTRVGERGFMRSYGSDLYKLVFSPNDALLHDIIRVYITDAIRKWEKRIKLIKISVLANPEDIDNSVVNIKIEYVLRNSNIYGSYVYPFVREPMQIGGK